MMLIRKCKYFFTVITEEGLGHSERHVSTRNELQEVRENGRDTLLEKAYLLCEEDNI